MPSINVAWMYPNLLNLHGERGSVKAFVAVAEALNVECNLKRIEDFDEEIDFDNIDLMIFLAGEINMFQYLMPRFKAQEKEFKAYLDCGGKVLAIGTTGLMFGKDILREDGSKLECLGYLDMHATERKYVIGDDIYYRINETKQEIVGQQIHMADVEAKHPFGTIIYGHGNNGTKDEGAKENNIIYTNCLGPLFVKNPQFAESLIKEICLNKYLKLDKHVCNKYANDSFESTV